MTATPRRASRFDELNIAVRVEYLFVLRVSMRCLPHVGERSERDCIGNTGRQRRSPTRLGGWRDDRRTEIVLADRGRTVERCGRAGEGRGTVEQQRGGGLVTESAGGRREKE